MVITKNENITGGKLTVLSFICTAKMYAIN